MCVVCLVVTVPSVKTWAPTPARTMGSPRLSGRTNSTNFFDSYSQHVILSYSLSHCLCHSMFCLTEKASSAPAKSVTYSGLFSHNTDRWVECEYTLMQIEFAIFSHLARQSHKNGNTLQ